jgi:hypothetical protein
MNDALTYIISSIVDNQEKVRIDEQDINGIITFEIFVAKEDIGKVIGKEGKIIRAIRNTMKIPAMKQNKKIQIAVNEFV